MSDTIRFDLRVRYPDFHLEVAAEIPLNGITALSGVSGSGKTTLLRALAGLERAAIGNVRFANENWTDRSAAERGIGYVFQDTRLFPHLTVQGNLGYGARRRGTAPERVKAIIAALDLIDLLGRMPQTLSGGETRRVALGRALASGPRILLLDEPLTGLDRARKMRLMPYIARAVAEFSVPAIYVTHSVAEISFLADRTLIIDGGRLIGWAPAPPGLLAQVKDAVAERVEVEIADMRIWLDGHGRPGEPWVLPLGQDFLISAEPPGQSNAALTLEGRVDRVDAAAGIISAMILGQVVDLPWSAGDGRGLPVGSRFWLSLPRVTGRPVQTDAG